MPISKTDDTPVRRLFSGCVCMAEKLAEPGVLRKRSSLRAAGGAGRARLRCGVRAARVTGTGAYAPQVTEWSINVRPNITKAGRIARATTGALCIGAGVVLWLVPWPETPAYRWIACIVLIAAGLFQLFEAKRGWCVARACGIKTPL